MGASKASLLDRIDHIVVVMLENRSFDHMLGFLYTDQGNKSPLGHPFEGLTGKEFNPDGKGGNVSVFKIQASDPHPYFMPGANPGEGYLNTNSQLFGKPDAPNPPGIPSNKGFVTNFAYTLGWEGKKPNQVIPGTTPAKIMGIYTPELLPVLSGLAKGYAVCDQWFSSAPTETMPNRAFAAMGTSQGHVDDSTIKVYTAPSIFAALGAKGLSWSIYGYNAPPLARASFADITLADASHFGQFKDFQQAVSSGKLANFVFLEPEWGTQGNSQHPNYDVSAGEAYLKEVYTTLFGWKFWNSTLLIITYDEHGGCYDHVPPPNGALPPDDCVGERGFDFKRFGLRVPAVLVSPLIAAGTVFRSSGSVPLDHTSILATVEQRFGIKPLTKRDAAAPHLGGVLTLQMARTDDPLSGVNAPTSKSNPKMPAGPAHLEQVLADGAAQLPLTAPGEKGHHLEPPKFKSGKDAVTFARKRFQQLDRKRK